MQPGYFASPRLMGIINVTPDSFSDGGLFFSAGQAIERGLRFIEDGADILDIGGESTRPGADPVAPAEEIRRILPVIEGLRGKGAMISVDTRHAATMRAAIEAGADMINDISALTHDADSLAAASGAQFICLMHMQGVPETMQDEPRYGNVTGDVLAYLRGRVAACVRAGIPREKLILDPGIGFGKNLADNCALLRHTADFAAEGLPVLVGLSRKSFIEKMMRTAVPPQKRLPGSLAGVLWCLQQGARIFRVHDVAETRQALRVYQEISAIA